MSTLKEIANGTIHTFNNVYSCISLYSIFPDHMIYEIARFARYGIAPNFAPPDIELQNGKLYIVDSKNKFKPVAYVNRRLEDLRAQYPNNADDYPALNAETGKQFSEKLVLAFIQYHFAADPNSYILRFARGPAIVAGYIESHYSVNSCMTYAANEYDTRGAHPTELYAQEINGLCALAVMRDANGRIAARALCHIGEGIASRIYSANDIARAVFIGKLARAGFPVHDATLEGLTFPAINISSSSYGTQYLLMPYLDRGMMFYNKRENLVRISDDNPGTGWREINAGSTSGRAPLNNSTCACCGDDYSRDEMEYINGQYVCRDCLENEYVFSDYMQQYLRQDESVYSEYLSDYFLSDDCVYSETMEDYILDSEAREVSIVDNGSTEISDYFPCDMDTLDCARMMIEAYSRQRARARRYG
jgi:hypothetical protein